MDIHCADCQSQCCQTRNRDGLPQGCPMEDTDYIENNICQYRDGDNQDFYADSLESMRRSFGRMPRIIEAVSFCKLRGYKKIGVAYCSGMLRFGKAVSDVFRQNGFEVCSVGCKFGGFSPEELVEEPGALSAPKPGREGKPQRAMCNPIGQAQLINRQHTDFNVVAGLCVGHDSLFFKYSEAPCTVVVLKDRLFPEQCAPSIQSALEWEVEKAAE